MIELENLLRRMDPWVARFMLDIGAAVSLSGLIVEVLKLWFN